ncbi:MAG: pyruvate kinase [Myxococcota bacterium]
MALSQMLRKTKLIATLGPASDSSGRIAEMIQAGMNVARLNFSHGSHEEHRRRLELVREASRALGVRVAVMLDTKGAEIRTGALEGGSVDLVEGRPFCLFVGDVLGTKEGVSVSYRNLPHEVKLGSAILLDDGRIELRVTSLADDAIRCEVLRGGELANRAGVNVPDTSLTLSALDTDRRDDLRFAIDHELDYIAASFVKSAADVAEIQRFVEGEGADIPIIAKIENREAVESLEEIVAVAAGTMVARGDLGVELAVEEVPLVQKRIIRRTVMNGKPVITATQMLDSMERNSRPTRAEASDVANAILDGTSAVMLSGETAKGRYPVEAVRTMSSLATKAEASLGEYGDLQQIVPRAAKVVTDGVAQAAVDLSRHLEAATILTLTASGRTSRSISKYRPDCPILAITTSESVARRLALNWGVLAVPFEGDGDDERQVRFGVERARELGLARPGEVVIVTAGISGEAGSTNLIRVVNA